MVIDGTTTINGVVCRAVSILHGLNNIKTACGRYAVIKELHTKPKVLTCLVCIVTVYRVEPVPWFKSLEE